MGGTVSSPKFSGICITLDAFGTLYRPKKPIAAQYLEVARRCGLKADIKEADLETSFRKAFKEQYARNPNYGKASGMSVQRWWDDVVRNSFLPLCRGYPLPPSLGSTLFKHFSSRDAYELYPDVGPFFRNMRKLQERFADPEGPMVVVGVITNSDSRVKQILGSLGLRVGPEWGPDVDLSKMGHVDLAIAAGREKALASRRQGRRARLAHEAIAVPDLYRSSDNINFLISSYQIGHEKPAKEIFKAADDLLNLYPLLRSASVGKLGNRSVFEEMKAKIRSHEFASTTTKMHVGDDYKKDYLAAEEHGIEALHLCRGKKPSELENFQISSLLDLSALIDKMANVDD